MKSSSPPLRLDDPNLLSGYDPGSVQRGLRYAAQGRVEVVDEGPNWVTASVQGSAADPYVTDLEWTDGPRGPVISDVCSCPLGGACKHAVALIVTIAVANPGADIRSIRTAPSAPLHFTAFDDDVERRHQRVTDELARMDDIATGSRWTSLPRPGHRAGSRDWRDALSDVAVASASDATPMALQFTVVSPRPTAYVPDPVTRIMVRPMRSGAKGKWVKTGASWRDIDSPYLHHNLRTADPSHLVTLRALGQCHAASLYSAGNDAIGMERFNAGVWTALRNAVAAGVHLISGSGDDITVRLADEPAHFTIDLTGSPTNDGDLSLNVGFVRDGELLELAPGRIGTIGSKPHGLYVIEGNRLELVPLDATVPDGLARLLGGPPVVVPADDVDEFLDDYHPQLARAATVTSSDGSVSDHAAQLDGLVARVDHHDVDSARLQWVVRYRRSGRVTTYRLWDSVGAARDRAAERELVQALELPTDLMDGLVGPTGRPLDLTARGSDAVTLLTQVVPWLVEQGQVEVEATGDAPELRRATGDPLIALDVSDSGDADGAHSDWFDLSVEVSIDGEPIEFARLFAALALDEPALVLPSGTWMPLDRPELDQLRDLIEEARGLTDRAAAATVRVNPFQTSWWNELTGLGVVRSQSQRWVGAVERLRDLDTPTPVDPPSGLAATLRPYQQDGLDWLAFLHRNELGGVLADDMGLGKTVQTLALFLHVLDQRPDARFLVVAPTSVVTNWHKEAAQFAPGVEVRTITETASRRKVGLADAIGDARIVVTSYALFRIEVEDYRELDWEMLVLDEAQFVKNHRAKTYQCVRRLDAPTKLAITGTPIENSLMDLWSLLSIVAPGLYPDPQRFSDVYRRPIESGQAPDLLATLRRRVAPLLRRRTKDEVLTELPPKTEQTVDIDLSAKHMRLYQTQLQQQRKKVLGLVGDVDQHRFEILKSLTILRQLSLDPALIDEEHDAVGSAKLDRLVDDLIQVTAEGHRALVFSTFTRFLARARARLDDACIGYAYLDGRTRNRDRAIAAFKDGDAPVFLISLKAGGFGLNLTEADYCFVLDPWWNPAAETQAVDRAHRIGQVNPVVVYRYVSTGTIEEKVMELQERKRALVSSVMDGDGGLSGALDADDIRALIDLPDGRSDERAS